MLSVEDTMTGGTYCEQVKVEEKGGVAPKLSSIFYKIYIDS